MTELDRRRFVLGLSAAASSVLLFGSCRRLDPSAVKPHLLGTFGEDEAWDQLGVYWLQQTGADRVRMLETLAERLGWRPSMTTRELVDAILAAMKEDFEQGRIDGPDDWALAETELTIYAVLSRDPAPVPPAEAAR